MIRGRVVRALAVAADDSTASDDREPAGPTPLPTLEDRANFYLRAVHGDRDFTNQEYSRARGLILQAMAADIAARSNIRFPDGASLSPRFPEHSTTLPNPFLEIGTSKPGYEPSTLNHSAGGVGLGERQASDQAVNGSRGEGAALLRQQKSHANQHRGLPPLVFSGGQAAKRSATVCAAAALAAGIVLWFGGILPTAWFGPNTPWHGSQVAVQTSRPDPSSRTPLASDRFTLADAQREIISALNAAELGSHEIAALLKRGQELIDNGKFRLARLVLEQAAEAGSGPAALALGRTYDPTLQERSRLRPDAAPDLAMARAWYEKARDRGSAEAARRLGQLPAPGAPSNPKWPK